MKLSFVESKRHLASLKWCGIGIFLEGGFLIPEGALNGNRCVLPEGIG